MTSKIRGTTCMTVLALFCLSTLLVLGGPAAWARQGYGQENPPKPSAEPAKPGQTAPVQPGTAVPAPPVNAKEEAAYKAFYEASDVQQQIQLGEEFLKKFPESRYREGVYARLTAAYLSVGQEERMFAAGEKTLEIDPNNVDVLSLMALVMPRRVNPNSLDADQKLQKSEKYSKQAIALLAAMPKPAELGDADFAKAKNEKLSMCHSGLGFVYYHRQKYADSAVELDQATKLAAAPDPADFYVLGLAYQQTKRFGDAATAFGHCGEASGLLQPRCQQSMEQAKKLAALEPAPPKQ